MKPDRSISFIKENFLLRGNSFKEGMYLLTKHLKDIEDREEIFTIEEKSSNLLNNYGKLVDNIDELYKEYESKLDNITSFKDGKKNLDSLLSKYTQLLKENTILDGPFQSLCIAERCSVWQKGRIEFTTKLDELSLTQTEIPCQDSDFLAAEYQKIETEDPPRWFQESSSWLQDFIRTNYTTLSRNSIPSSLRSVPGLANLSKYRCVINGVEKLSYFRHATPRPVDLMNNGEPCDEEYRITCLNMASQIRLSLDDQFKRADKKPIREAVILTQSLLSPGIAANVKSMFVSGPSDNDTAIYETKEEIVELFQYALSHPNDFLDKKHARAKALFFSEADNQSVRYKDFLIKWDLKTQSDGVFKYKEHQSIKITLLSTNHPINILRLLEVYPKQTTNNEHNTALLLGVIARHLSQPKTGFTLRDPKQQQEYFSQRLRKRNPSIQDKLLLKLSMCEHGGSVSKDDKQAIIKILDDLLKQEFEFEGKNTTLLFHAMQVLLSTPLDRGSLTHHNQLMIVCAEAIILHCIDGSLWVGCKSGKDRTGIAIVACCAAVLYYEQNLKLPGYKDEPSDRTAYVTLLQKLFDSGHHQKAAAENAPGAEGIVKPGMILPGDVPLDAYAVQLSTALARLNKPSYARSSLLAQFSPHKKTVVFFKQSLDGPIDDNKSNLTPTPSFKER